MRQPWLIAELGGPLRVLSWSLTRPGFTQARRIVWREVRNADLPVHLNARDWLSGEINRGGFTDAVPLLTSRDIRRFQTARHEVEDVRADAIATVGLSNAERIGQRRAAPEAIGTINIAVRLSTPLGDGAFIEALSLVAQARTTAVLEHGPRLPMGRATGTGTDCIAIAAPPGDTAHAGMHTAIGEAVGRTVLDAVAAGVQDWMQEQGD
ncbi:MAG: adenosylcobinamide amidohydrolase [Pseudomonadota bacterium]